MLAAERILLYALSLSLAALLVRELTASSPTVEAPAKREGKTIIRLPQAESGQPGANEITLADALGTPRLVLSLAADGSPRLAMNDIDGQSGVELTLSNEGVPLLQLSRGDGTLRCEIDAFGSVTC
jgi:hypothetical protein